MEPHDIYAEMIDVTKTFGEGRIKSTVLNSVNFEVHSGELLLILGPSGSGKSTFLTILAGLQKPTYGTIRLFGKDIADYDKKELQRVRAAQIGFIFQSFNLLESLTVQENVLLVSKFIGTPRHIALERTRELMQYLGIDHLYNSYPSHISQGEKQRVAVARALMNGAKLILADEPTGSLSSEQGMQIIQLLKRETSERGRGVIVVSHDERIRALADRTFLIQDGIVAELE